MRAGGSERAKPKSLLSPITSSNTVGRSESALDSPSSSRKPKWLHANRRCHTSAQWLGGSRDSPSHNIQSTGSPHKRRGCTSRHRFDLPPQITVGLEHYNEEPDNVSYACPYCPRLFVRKSALNKHLCSHLKQKKFRCLHCPKSFKKKSNLARHLRSHLKKNSFNCKPCGKLFSHKKDLSAHLKTHEATTLLSCFHCSRTITPSRRHRLGNITDSPKQFSCNTCVKAFVQSPTLGGKHLPMLAGGNRAQTAKKPFKCRHCDRSFTRRSLLTKHVRARTVERPYKCVRCCKAFSTSENMAAHLRTHGQNSTQYLVLPKLR